MLLRLLYIWIYNPRYLLNKDDSGCLSLEWRNTYPACSARHRRPCRPKWLHTEKKREFSQRFFRLCSSVYEVHTCTMCWESTLEHINMFEAVEKKGLPKIVISYFWVAYASYPGPTTSAVNSSSTHLCHQLNCYWYRLVLTQVGSDKFTRSAVHNTLWGTDNWCLGLWLFRFSESALCCLRVQALWISKVAADSFAASWSIFFMRTKLNQITKM